MIQAGLAGYPYCCPDMVGGGQETQFGDGKTHDMELFIRACQCTALMPMMQFSYAIWAHYQNEEVLDIVRETAHLRGKYASYIEGLIEEARTTCAPILRNLEYEYPHQGLQNVQDEFLLGRDILVAPVLEKEARSREVILPKGDSWRYIPTGEVFAGGQTALVDAPIDVLPYFERVI
jgi:alpha-glucosidase